MKKIIVILALGMPFLTIHAYAGCHSLGTPSGVCIDEGYGEAECYPVNIAEDCSGVIRGIPRDNTEL